MLTLARGPVASGGRTALTTLRSTRLFFVVLFAFCCFNFSLTATAQYGRVYGWGWNPYGQVGDGSAGPRTTPVQASGLTNIISVDGGGKHTLALRADGTVWAWGSNFNGQLGTGNNNDSLTPVLVTGLAGVKAISAGENHSLALKPDGTVWAWGDNSLGQLGDGSTNESNVPVQVPGLTDVVAISACVFHNLAIKSDGTVWTWGYNSNGQIGDDTTTDRLTPFQVPDITTAKDISGGALHSLVLLSDGTLKAWGDNRNGQLGDGTNFQRNSPVDVTVLSGRVKALARSSGGGRHTLVLMEDGTIKGWGSNASGELGIGSNASPQMTAVTVQGLTGVKMVAQGGNHSMALLSDGTVKTWGHNMFGQLGNGTETDSNIPVDTGLVRIASIGAGSNHSLAVETIIPPIQPGQLIISEFRLHGPNGTEDEFVELYNTTNSPLTVFAQDGSAGFALVASDGLTRCLIPNFTAIPARGHFLCVNNSSPGGYSLSNYPARDRSVPGGKATATATGDATYTRGIPDNSGIALFDTSLFLNFTIDHRLDAVGSALEANTLFKEGTGYPTLQRLFGNEHSFYRDLSSGVPKDTDNNSADFLYVDTSGTLSVSFERLGAPGPENLSSPVQHNGWLTPSLIDPSVAASAAPNRVRDQTPVPNGTYGTIDIRRRYTNNTGSPVTRLRFRVVNVTTLPSPSPTIADVRALSSPTITVSGINSAATSGANPVPCSITVQGTTLEQPPNQTLGGGYNSTLSADTVTLITPLENGQSINVRWLLGVEQKGNFSFYVNIEMLP